MSDQLWLTNAQLTKGGLNSKLHAVCDGAGRAAIPSRPMPADKDKDAEIERSDTSATAYARQLSAYTARLAREGTTLTA